MKAGKHRFLAMALALSLAVGMVFPTGAQAAEAGTDSGEGKYLVYEWNESTQTLTSKYEDIPEDAITITADYFDQNGYTLNGGTYCVTETVTISEYEIVIISGEVHLILMDNCFLNAQGGITVLKENSLSIYAQSAEEATMGKLTAIGYTDFCAGIGGSRDCRDCGTITIHGGNVNAQGGDRSAGIGGGRNGNGGEITIYGGNVEATSPHYGAGIGCGQNGNGGKITIRGGTVKAYGNWGAGIGSGNVERYVNLQAISFIDTITISGGKVEANFGGGRGAGIGTAGEYGTVGNISITGGTVSTNGCIGAADGYGKAQNIIISGGSVSAEGYIGSGSFDGQSGASGKFSTTAPDGTPGNAIITVQSIKNTKSQSDWSGVIFQTDSEKGDGNGEVYGFPSLEHGLEIPAGKTLTIPDGKSLTVGEGVTVTVTNKGTLTVNNGGSLVNRGTITVEQGGTLGVGDNGVFNNMGTLNNQGEIQGNYNDTPSEVMLTVSTDPAVSYGGSLTLTATIEPEQTTQASTDMRLRGVSQNTVVFYKGDTQIGTAPVENTNGTKTATLTINNLDWMPGTYMLTASYTGGDDKLLPSVSDAVSLTVAKASQSAPTISIDYTNETLFTNTTMQYRTDDGASWSDCTGTMAVTADGFGWDGTGNKTVQFRTKETDTASASAVNPFTIPARPEAPTGLKGENTGFVGEKNGKITGLDTKKSYQFSSADGTTWEDVPIASTEITGLAAGTYQVRLKATNSAFASVAETVPVGEGVERTYMLNVAALRFDPVTYGYTQSEAKGITISSTGNSDATISGVALSDADAGVFALNNENGTTITAGETDDTTYTVEPAAGLGVGTYTAVITVTYDGGATATNTVTFVVSGMAQDAPAAPEMESKTTSSITLKAIDPNGLGAAVEYCMNGGAWQTSPVFSGLSSNTSYTFEVRYAATGNYEASPSSTAASFTTDRSGGSSGGSNGGSSGSLSGGSLLERIEAYGKDRIR